MRIRNLGLPRHRPNTSSRSLDSYKPHKLGMRILAGDLVEKHIEVFSLVLSETSVTPNLAFINLDHYPAAVPASAASHPCLSARQFWNGSGDWRASIPLTRSPATRSSEVRWIWVRWTFTCRRPSPFPPRPLSDFWRMANGQFCYEVSKHRFSCCRNERGHWKIWVFRSRRRFRAVALASS